MKISNEALEKIKEFEGCKLKAYKCSGGVWTIGYGHTRGVKQGMIISKPEAELYLRDDIQEAEIEVESLGEWTQGQFDALVSFVFNFGIVKLKRSTLIQKIRSNASRKEIRFQFGRWVYSNGERTKGLIIRRHWEADTFLGEKTELVI